MKTRPLFAPLLALLLPLTVHSGGPPRKPTPRRPAAPAGAQALFRRLNLAPLWILHPREAEAQPMLGCMGPNSRPFDLVYEKVQRDAKNPALYYVQGQSRERERILPFSGIIRLTSIRKVVVEYPPKSFHALVHYQAEGTFQLVEQGEPEEAAGTFTGKLSMAFSQLREGLAYMPPQGALWEFTAGEGTRFTSTWTSKAHPKPVRVIWASNFLDIADNVIERFHVGERGQHLNPKYARVGWSEYWQNDEWWTDDDTPALGLRKISILLPDKT